MKRLARRAGIKLHRLARRAGIKLYNSFTRFQASDKVVIPTLDFIFCKKRDEFYVLYERHGCYKCDYDNEEYLRMCGVGVSLYRRFVYYIHSFYLGYDGSKWRWRYNSNRGVDYYYRTRRPDFYREYQSKAKRLEEERRARYEKEFLLEKDKLAVFTREPQTVDGVLAMYTVKNAGLMTPAFERRYDDSILTTHPADGYFTHCEMVKYLEKFFIDSGWKPTGCIDVMVTKIEDNIDDPIQKDIYTSLANDHERTADGGDDGPVRYTIVYRKFTGVPEPLLKLDRILQSPDMAKEREFVNRVILSPRLSRDIE